MTHGVAASATESERLTDLGRERSALTPGASLRIVLESFTDIMGNLPRLRGKDKTARASILAKYNSMAKTSPNKSKENQGKPRKKAWIYLDSFGRIGTFQRVTAIPNKKISLGLNSRLRLLFESISRAFLTSCPGVQTSLIRSSYRRYEMVKTLWQGILKKSRHWLIILMGGIMAGAAAVSPAGDALQIPRITDSC